MAVTLFENKRDCCGCGACKNVCPREAISMAADADGFLYPQIDAQLCVECGACQKVCGYQNLPDRSRPIACYAAAARDEETLKKSASGGMFAVTARKLLEQGGVVYGVAMPMEEAGLTARHVRIDSVQALATLQGSKYVQSDTALIYRQAREDLREGRQVLFSGTPCQIAGLLGFLGRKYENLLTMEVICHGVPSGRMFRDFLKSLEKRKGSAVAAFAFRTKEKGQGMNTCVNYLGKDGRNAVANRNGHLYSYMHYFLKSYIYRDNCYSCPFAAAERVADITIGDYWGFHEEHPVLGRNVKLSNARGVSCVLLNSENGVRHFEACSHDLTVLATEFEKVARHNEQLRKPCTERKERDVILRLYREQGYSAVEQHFRKTCRKDRAVSVMMDLMPKGLKRTVKRMIGLVK